MTDWKPLRTLPETTDKVLFATPFGHMEVRRANEIREGFLRPNMPLEDRFMIGFYWAPISPIPTEQSQ